MAFSASGVSPLFQSTRLHEARRTLDIKLAQRILFQSTRLHEARQESVGGVEITYPFQSTRLHEARRLASVNVVAIGAVSIHAPA